MAAKELTVPVTVFKANCLKLFKRLEQGKLARVTVTRRGKPVASVGPAPAAKKQLADAYGFMRGLIHFSPDYDPFERVIDDPKDPFFDTATDSDAA